jgi:nitrite reductase/ring-hydroxylating ferredoxin subunit
MAKTVGRIGELAPGSITAFEIEGKSVALANVGGAFFAVDNVCTHRGCSLATGTLDGSVVTCPCHGSRFEVATGVVVAGPATVGLGTYAVEVLGDDVQISLPTGSGEGGQVRSAPNPSEAPQAEAEPEASARVLAAVPLFSGLDAASIGSLVAFTFRRTFQAGEVIVEEGSTGNGLYVVLSGQVEVVKGLGGRRPQQAAILSAGEPFGEMALLGDWKRSASIRALEPSVCLGMDRWVFLAHLQREPQLAVRLLQVLARRLAETNEKLVE